MDMELQHARGSCSSAFVECRSMRVGRECQGRRQTLLAKPQSLQVEATFVYDEARGPRAERKDAHLPRSSRDLSERPKWRMAMGKYM